jgi:hypothetical protein
MSDRRIQDTILEKTVFAIQRVAKILKGLLRLGRGHSRNTLGGKAHPSMQQRCTLVLVRVRHSVVGVGPRTRTDFQNAQHICLLRYMKQARAIQLFGQNMHVSQMGHMHISKQHNMNSLTCIKIAEAQLTAFANIRMCAQARIVSVSLLFIWDHDTYAHCTHRPRSVYERFHIIF